MKVEIASVKDCTGKFVDVIKELGDFYNALKLKNPSLEFKPCTSRKYLGDDGAVVAYGLLDVVDVDNHEFNLGKIMFWNDKYTVVSRLLINNKFSCWNREEYHSKSSVHMKKVIKPALESLLPLFWRLLTLLPQKLVALITSKGIQKSLNWSKMV